MCRVNEIKSCSLLFLGLVISVLCISDEKAQNISTKDDNFYKKYLSMPKLFQFDDYHECMLLEEAKYCRVTFKLHPKNPENVGEIWKTIQEFSSEKSKFRHDLLRHGICVSEKFPAFTFSADDETSRANLTEHYNENLHRIGIVAEIVELTCESKVSKFSVDVYDYSFLIFIAVYVCIVIFASGYETKSRAGKILTAFSIPRNFERLTKIDWESQDVRNLATIQGIRFYNMILVILCHSCLMNFMLPPVNPLYLETLKEKVLAMVLFDEGCVVQTNLLISNFLLMYHFLTYFENKNIKFGHLVQGFVFRYLRLTPTLAVVVFFQSTWLVHFARGPFWDEIIGSEYDRCRENWWTNLLYLNNFVNKERMCMLHTWYLATDTQLFIVILLLLYFTWKLKHRIFEICFSILTIQAAIIFYIVYSNNWISTLSQETGPEIFYEYQMRNLEQFYVILVAPYTNLAGPIIGLIFGYIFYTYKDAKVLPKGKLTTTFYLVLSLGPSISVTVLANLIVYSANFELNLLYIALYVSVKKIIFATSIGIGVFASTQGHDAYFKTVCEFSFVYIMGRLSYSAYLIHVTIQLFRNAAKSGPNYLADHYLFFDAISDIVMSYSLAFVMTLLFEMPTSALLKNLTNKESQAVKNSTKNQKKTS